MRRILEAIFRRPVRLVLLIVVLSAAGFGVAYALPRSYASTARLWAFRPYVDIGTSVNPNDTTTPAQSQATALNEMLQTRGFALAVARKSPSLIAALSLGSDGAARRDDALFAELSKRVDVGAGGNNLFTVSYTSTDPKVAQQIVAAVIHNYTIQTQTFTASENQSLFSLLNDYQVQLALAQNTSDAAIAAENQYLATHPGKSQSQLLTDPRYVQLHVQAVQAQTSLQDLQNSTNTISQEIQTIQGAGNDSLFAVLDAPEVPSLPVSRTNQLVEAGGIGLAVALLACALYIFAIVRRDHGVYTAYDLGNVTAFPLVMQVPDLSSSPLARLIKRPARHSA